MPNATDASRKSSSIKSPPDLGLPRYHQSMWSRIVRIHAFVCEGRKFTTADLQRDFETDERTVHRTLAAMRDELGAPLKFNRQTNTFYYEREWRHLPHMVITPDERLVVKFIRQLLPDRKDAALGRTLQSLVSKLEWIAGNHGEPEQVSDTWVISAAVLGAAEQRHLPEIQRAIEAGAELQIEYRKPGSVAAEPHVIQPHLLRFIRHQWVLLTHDVTRAGDLRTFVLRRVVAASRTGRHFTRPAGFDPQAILDGNFGAYTGTGDHHIRLALRGAAAVDAREQPWHHSQRIVDRPEGALELTLRLNNLVDIKHEVLRWGELAEALEPVELRRAVRGSLRSAARLYEGGEEEVTLEEGSQTVKRVRVRRGAEW